ncbi:MAG: hypothetical protein MJ219_00335 [Mycoplasmoidaceae bacterium]|nr:hypothetical protein [Mycoplasmoidaceae bacterium]
MLPTSIVGLLTTSCNNSVQSKQNVYIVHTFAEQSDVDWETIPQAPVNIFK